MEENISIERNVFRLKKDFFWPKKCIFTIIPNSYNNKNNNIHNNKTTLMGCDTVEIYLVVVVNVLKMINVYLTVLLSLNGKEIIKLTCS